MTPDENDQVTVHQFNSNRIEAHMIDDEPWFIAKEVCDVLGLTKHRDAVARLAEDETRPLLVATRPVVVDGETELVDGKDAPHRTMTAVNEPGLYRLIFQSRKPEAEAFKRWVTHEVLPAIRKTGQYGAARADRQDRMLDLLEKSIGFMIEQSKQMRGKTYRRRFDMIEKAEILKLREQGLTLVDIAERFQSTAGSISSVISRANATAKAEVKS